ncbi:MAG: oligopeptide/dipeptide ABC transporter ATP-binding protein [Gammaproteobacteria bacterium]
MKPVLSVRRLTIDHHPAGRWPWSRAGLLRAVDDVHFDLQAGEALGIVGEAGCGKTTLARALVGLQDTNSGGMVLDGKDLSHLDDLHWRPLRRDIQMVFQDPVASLDPRMTIARSVEEPLRSLSPELDAAARAARVLELLARVGLGEAANRYPYELDAGQCQRAGIARALAVKPKVLICDEPVSALDAATRAQVLDLLNQLQREQRLALVLISRDLTVIQQACRRVLVMYLGRVMEQTTAEELFARPRHPYTRALLASMPGAEPGRHPVALDGEMPDPLDPPSGCVFRTRCPMADDVCARDTPHLRKVGEGAYAACHFVQDPSEGAPLLKEGSVSARRPARKA